MVKIVGKIASKVWKLIVNIGPQTPPTPKVVM